MTKDRIVEKVQKLLALAGSSNENEAALAAQRAQELMLRYGIELAAVAAANEETGVGVAHSTLRGGVDPWRVELAGGVATALGGRMVYSNDYRKWTGEIEFWGPRGSVEGMAALYQYLEGQLVVISALAAATRKNEIGFANAAQSMRWRRSFLMGAAVRLSARLYLRHREVADESTGNSTALVLIKSSVDRAVEDKYPGLQRARATNVDAGAYASGRAAATTVDLGDARLRNDPTALEERV